jgi:hypothetical protein
MRQQVRKDFSAACSAPPSWSVAAQSSNFGHGSASSVGNGRQSGVKRPLPLTSAFEDIVDEAAADLEQLEGLIQEAGQRVLELHEQCMEQAAAWSCVEDAQAAERKAKERHEVINMEVLLCSTNNHQCMSYDPGKLCSFSTCSFGFYVLDALYFLKALTLYKFKNILLQSSHLQSNSHIFSPESSGSL